jgi:transcriptional regulator with XRE-family HTH domain
MVEEKIRINQKRYMKYASIRDEQHKTDAQVSRETGILQSTFSDWKSGNYTPAFGNIVKIAECLGVSANTFEIEQEGE